MQFKDQLIQRLGFSASKADETIANKSLSRRLEATLELAIKTNGDLTKGSGLLLYKLCTQWKEGQGKPGRRDFIVASIANGAIVKDAQLAAACEYVLHEQVSECVDLDVAAFNEYCGVGVEMNEEIVDQIIEQVVAEYRDKLMEQQYQFPVAKLIGAGKSVNKWVDMAIFKPRLDAKLAELLGPKPAVSHLAKSSTTAKKTSGVMKEPEAKAVEEAEHAQWGSAVGNLHEVGGNYTTDQYVTTPNTSRLLREHVAIVKNKVRTRFPPEPNGILHIGHAKAMNFNFSYAKENGGTCYLRFDDTNPEAEEDEYYTGILDMVRWLGWKPDAIVHASDYFHELYTFAEALIARGLAYVDHQTSAQIKTERQLKQQSPHRNRAVHESLKIFYEMKQGLWDEGTACVRMKMDVSSGNPMMWDLVAFRVKFWRHVRTGDEWCIYPTYDFTHCLCDSVENITHSLCTVEFKQSRTSYYWLCNALEIYCPVQWEYARLALTGTVLSKRRIVKMVDDGIVSGWDDPRLHTLPALRRRGYTPAAINDLCVRVGITTSHTTVSSQLLESCLRDDLNKTSVRASAVLHPLQLVLLGPTNPPHAAYTLPTTVEVPNNPTDLSMGVHTVPFGQVIYIDRDDYCDEMPRGYRRFSPGQPVGLKHIGLVLTYSKGIRSADTNELIAVHVTYEPVSATNKPKAFIHWIANPRPAEIRFFEPLLIEGQEVDPEEGELENEDSASAAPRKNSDPSWYKSINRNSIKVYTSAIVDASLDDAKVYDKFQFERIGYFCVDKDSNTDRKVFNLSVGLKAKNAD